MKCDLSRPSCLKCHSTGRTCDGYKESPCYSNDKIDRAESRDSHRSCTIISTYQSDQRQWHEEDYHGLSLLNPRPFMILPMTRSAPTEAISFFGDVSIKHLNKYQPYDESWHRTLMFFSQTVPSVRNAAIALALLHRNYIHADHNSGSRDSRLLDKEAPLFYYTMAIQHLLNQDLSGHDSAQRTAITLLVCYLFTCFDHLAGNDVQAMKHLRGGVELSRNLDKAENTDSSEVGKLIGQVTSQIRRLDMQAVMFLIDWTPADIQKTAVHQLAPFKSSFESLGQAADCIQMLIARVMSLRNEAQQMYPTGEIPPPPSSSSSKDVLLCQLETWSTLFENTLQRQHGSSSSHNAGSESNTLATLLRLQHKIAWIFLSSYGPGREMEYDAFLPQFQQCVALASDVAAAHERYSGSLRPTFTPEIGILPVLYIIGAKCRHSLVRRDVLNILRRQSIREAVWNSIWTARILERVIEIEEGASEEGIVPQRMDQIAVWQRIEALSWIHVVDEHSAPRLDLTYTFCTREGTHTESLMI